MKISLSPKISNKPKLFLPNNSNFSKSTKEIRSLPLLSSFTLKSQSTLVQGFSPLDAQSVYKAKCKDLNIPSSKDQEQKFIVNFLNSVQGRKIDLNGSGLGKHSAQVISEVLKKSPHYFQVILSNNNLSDEGCGFLGKMLRNNLTIIHLDLSGNNLSPEGASNFFKKLINNQALISLDLSSKDRMNKNRIGLKGSHALSNYLYRTLTLTFLNLSGACIGKEGLEYISLGLSYNSSLLTLNLSFNSLDGRSIQTLCSSIGKCKLKELILSGNPGISKGSDFICNYLLGKYEGGCHINKLDLSRCDFDDESAEKVLFGLETNMSVTDLNLSNNPLGCKTGDHISRCLEKNSMVQHLNLAFCNLTEEGMSRMVAGLSRNFTLKSLNLANNYLCDSGMKALSEALKRNSGLQNLDLASNLIKNLGGQHLIDSLYKNLTIRSINLNSNSLKDEIGHDLLAVVSRCKNIQFFSLEFNSVNLKYVKSINKCLLRNQKAFKSAMSPKIQSEIERLVISDEHIEKVFTQISSKSKEKEEAHRKFFKQRTKFFEVKYEENEKFEVLKEERNSILTRKQSLTREHDITYFDVSKTKFQKEKEMKEIKEAVLNVGHNINALKKRRRNVHEIVVQKKQKFGSVVFELKNQLVKVENERNKVRNELEEMKVTFQSICEQLIQVKNSLSKDPSPTPEKPKLTEKRKRPTVLKLKK